MGGCASRPKDLAFKAEKVPEAPVSPKEANNVSQGVKDEGVEIQQAGDAPADVDSSEPKKEQDPAVSAEAEKLEEEMAVSTESKPETKVEESKPEEPKVEVEESKSEETKVEAVVKTEA